MGGTVRVAVNYRGCLVGVHRGQRGVWIGVHDVHGGHGFVRFALAAQRSCDEISHRGGQRIANDQALVRKMRRALITHILTTKLVTMHERHAPAAEFNDGLFV